MASLPARVLASFQANIPNPTLNDLDGEFNQLVGSSGIFTGGTDGTKLLLKSSDATDPPFEFDQIGAGPLVEFKQNSVLKASIANTGQIVSEVATGTAPFDVDSTTLVTNLNADMLDDRHLTGIQVSFSAGFSIVDPSTATLNSRDFGSLIIPAGGSYTITQLKVMFRQGVHTLNTSITFTFDRSGVGDIGSVMLNNVNNLAGVVYVNDIADLPVPENAILSVRISATVGAPITQRSVMAVIEGFRTAF